MIADLRYLNSLMGYDASRTQRFLDVYKSDIPGQMDMLLVQIEENNHAEVRKLAHSIKGQSAYIMAEAVVKIAQQIEEDADNGLEMDTIHSQALGLKKAIEKVLQML